MSLRLKYNSTENQSIVVTLSEKLSTENKCLTGLTYDFVFTNDQDDNVINISLIDQGLFPTRYNLFSVKTDIINSGTTTIQFPLSGWYKYEVYLHDETTLLEIGKLYVYDTTITTEYINTTDTKYIYKK